MTGEQFRQARKALGWSSSALAERLGVSRQTVWELERSAQVRALYALAMRALMREQAELLAAA